MKKRAIKRWISLLPPPAPRNSPSGRHIFVRSDAELDRARRAVEGGGLPFRVLDETVETVSGHVAISTMHLAKGLEFRAVAVMACDDEVVPSARRI